jgi:hypothetical protein
MKQKQAKRPFLLPSDEVHKASMTTQTIEPAAVRVVTPVSRHSAMRDVER